jgi:hypothetical protein
MNKFNFSHIGLIATTALIAVGMAIFITPIQTQAAPLLISGDGSNKVYFVNQKNYTKKEILNERVFASYNNKWSEVRKVTRDELKRYPDVRLIKVAGDDAIYYIKGGNKQHVPSVDVFYAHGFSWDEVLTVNSTDFRSYKTGKPLTYPKNIVRQASTAYRTASGNTYTNTANVNAGELKITRVDKNPRSDNGIAAKTPFPLMTIRLSSGSKYNATVDRLTFEVLGLNASDANVGSFSITDNTGATIAHTRSAYNGKVEFIFTNPLVIVAKKSTDLTIVATPTKPNIYIALRLLDKSSIGTTARINTKFPVDGYYYRILDEPYVTGHVTVVPMSITPDMRQTTAGSQNQLITKISIIEKVGDGDIQLEKLVLTKTGNLPDNQVCGIEIVDKDNKVIARGSRLVNGRVTFDLERRPYKMDALSRQTFFIRADFSKAEGQTFGLTIAKPQDVGMTTDVNGGIGHIVVQLGPIPVHNVTQILPGNAINTINNVKTEFVVDYEKPITLFSFNLKAGESNNEVNLRGFELKIDNYGPNRAIDYIQIRDNGEVIADYRVKDFWGVYGTVSIDQKDIPHITSRAHKIEVIGYAHPKATAGDALRVSLKNFDIANASGYQEGSGWMFEGSRINFITR